MLNAFFQLLSLECNNNIGYNFSTLVPLSNLNINFVTHLENADFLNMENWEELALKRKVERPQINTNIKYFEKANQQIGEDKRAAAKLKPPTAS